MGLPKWQSLMELSEAIGASDVGQTLSRAGKMLGAGMSADALASALAEQLRDLLILRTCPADADLVDVAAVQIEDLKRLAQKFDPAALVQDITVLEEVRRQMRQGHGGRALLDAALARLAMADQFASIDQLLGRVDRGGTGAPAASSPAPEKKKSDDAVMPPVSAAPAIQKPADSHPPGFPAARDVPPPPRLPAPTPVEPAPTIRITAELTAELENDPAVGAVLRELGGRIVKVE
jgi:DNA polymerase III gamma/tau subunit